MSMISAFYEYEVRTTLITDRITSHPPSLFPLLSLCQEFQAENIVKREQRLMSVSFKVSDRMRAKEADALI